VRGGILGSTIGFGIGHAVQGRWKSDGWIYTAGEIAGIGLMTTGQIIAMDGVLHYAKGSDGNGKPTVLTDSMEKQLITGAVLFGSGLLMFTGFRIAESITVWETPALAASSTMLDSGLNQKVSQLAPAEQNTAIVGMKLNF